MSQIQGCPCPPRLTPGHLIFLIFFWSNSPPCGPFLCLNAPLPRDFLGVKCPAPRAEVTKTRLNSENLNEVFNTAISIIFSIPVQRLCSSFFFLCTYRPPRVQVRAQCVRNIAIVCFKTRGSPRARISTF